METVLRFTPAIALLFLSPVVLLSAAEAPARMLTSSQEVRGLNREEAAQGLPVSVRGVLTFVARNSLTFTVDDGVGIWVNARPSNNPPSAAQKLRVGDLVEVRGRSHTGLFAPIIAADQVVVLGRLALPAARPVAAAGLALGSNDCQRVEIMGVVETAQIVSDGPDSGALKLAVSTSVGRFDTMLSEKIQQSPRDLVDAEVSVVGVFVAYRNSRGQFQGGRIFSNSSEDLRISLPPKHDPFDVPLVGLRDIMVFSPREPDLHRRRVKGVVTLCVPGHYFFLQDGSSALKVNTLQFDQLLPGETVEASGFFHLESQKAEMYGADFRRLGHMAKIAPAEITAADVMVPPSKAVYSPVRDYDEHLVALRGRLLEVNHAANGLPVLTIESDDVLVPVRFSTAQDFAKVINLRPGSELSITGICSVSFSKLPGLAEEERPTAFGLLLRGVDDVRILKAASWWTRGRLLAALGLTGALLLVFLVWSAVLRRTVEVKSTKLVSEMRARRDAEVEFESTLRERNRLAADLHDTTEQALTGLAIQLEVGQTLRETDPQRSFQHLSLALQLLDRSREDLRRSIWNLRANPLDQGTFVEALQQVAADRSIGIPLQISVVSDGPPRPLEDFVAGNLILLAQEGITNAIKHAEAGQIGLKLEYGEKTVSLTVWDDGRGFDPRTAVGLKEGHFGLQGMRERIKRLAGAFEVRSVPGQGTSIMAMVPS